MEELVIRQGDQYSISFPIMLDKHIVTDDLINSVDSDLNGDVEIVIGRLRKTFRNGEVKFNTKTYTFDFPLTQEETLKLRGGMRLKSQVRVKLRKFSEGEMNTIYSYNGPDVIVIGSLSREQI